MVIVRRASADTYVKNGSGSQIGRTLTENRIRQRRFNLIFVSFQYCCKTDDSVTFCLVPSAKRHDRARRRSAIKNGTLACVHGRILLFARAHVIKSQIDGLSDSRCP